MDEEGKGRWILFLLLLLISSSFVSGKKWNVSRAEYQSLNAIKLELIDSRGVLSSWDNRTRGTVCSTWAGIKCLNGHVVAIQLPWKGLEGRISHKVGLLPGLRYLSLHHNSLTGPIPASLGNLPHLRGLYLFNNRLSGSIPPALGNCLNLQIVDLSTNELSGIIPTTLANSSRLYRLNLSFNKILGLIPASLSNLTTLEELNLSHNKIVGNIPDEFGHMLKLSFLDLSYNGISGNFLDNLSELSPLQTLNLKSNNLDGLIPESIGKLGNLSVLDLSKNRFKGQIPTSLINIPKLSSLDVSYNNLSGSVPSVLASKFNSSSFVGNVELCGYSSSTICPSQEHQNPPSSSSRGRKLSIRDIILIAAGGAILIVLLVLCCVLLCCLVRRNAVMKAQNNSRRAEVEIGGKLVHFDGPLVFAADDLLCASAEIMGKSAYGTIYRATMEDYSQVAVKRLRENITKVRKEFELEVAHLGRIQHSNILPLRAYYIGPKGEKLLVYDYISNGSLSSFLHARGPETIIPWETRRAIALGIARGLSYLHEEENLVHGNLTSTNILIDEQDAPMIADVGLSCLMTPDAVSNTSGLTGYRAPELAKPKDASTKSDIYSLGVVILELLTGKSPSEVCDGLHLELPQWVASIVKEEWTNEVFDVEIMSEAPEIGEELLSVLKLALHCVDPDPEDRPQARDVARKLEELKLDSIDNETLQAQADEAAAVSIERKHIEL